MTEFPDKPQVPVFKSMTPEQNEAWLNAHNWVYASVLTGISRMKGSDWSWYGSMFGGRTGDGERVRRERVRSSLEKMAKRMAETVITYEPSNDKRCESGGLDDRTAFVEVNPSGGENAGTIHLCPRAFNDDFLRASTQDTVSWARAFVIAHEMYHLAVDTKDTAGAADAAYSKLSCDILAIFNPDAAVKNAQNYAYYLMGEWWVRPAPEPRWPADEGLWHDPVAGGVLGETSSGPAAAGTSYVRDAVVLAWRGSDADGGRLWHRVLRIEKGAGRWTDPLLLGGPKGNGGKGEITIVGSPALAVNEQEFHCAYIDQATKKLMLVETPGGVAHLPTDYSRLEWGAPSEIANDPLYDPGGSPSIAVYNPRQGFNRSVGLYCAYVSNENVLKCRARLDGPVRIADDPVSPWIDVRFDQTRMATGRPTLFLLNGQLRCMYRNSSGHFVTLVYKPAVDGPIDRRAQEGSWEEEATPMERLENSNFATLGTWGAGESDWLFAIRHEFAGERKGSLSYARRYQANGKAVWTPDTRMPLETSPYPPVLASCGPASYLFFADANGRIRGRMRAGRAKS